MTCLLFAGALALSRDLYSDTWAATDGLGRVVTMGKPGEELRKNRTVGMFYFLSNRAPGAPIYDNTKILAANPTNPQYGPFMTSHWWGEPWFGYYQSDDKAVIRKHMQMLADAGVDVIVFDNTNGPTYPDVYIPLFEVIREMRAQGNPAPQVAFFTGHGAWSTLYRDLYSKGLYSDLWFRWKGKPLMMAHLDDGDTLPPEIMSFFNVRESWAWTPSKWFGDGHDKWPWLDNYPQHFGWHEDPSRPEEVSVCVGQHATSSIGRSSLAQKEPPVDDKRLTPFTAQSLCFAQQFERALKIDPEFIFITGWNEWTATRFKSDQDAIMAGKPEPKGGCFFVDEYNAEFSRDIEPAKGITSDNYYYQLVDFVRRYKGARPVPPCTARTIDLKSGFAQWNLVRPEFRDEIGDTGHRDHIGWGSEHYVNASGRNDIVASKVAYDRDFIYFYIRCAAPMTPSTDPNWMLLFLDADANAKTGWLGYDFVVRPGQGSLIKNVGGEYKWKPSGPVSIELSRDRQEMMLRVDRRALGIAGAPATVDFKWADNIAGNGEASDFTLKGDSAPNDRFNYRAVVGDG